MNAQAEDDPFERAVARERELRDQMDEDVHLTVEQLRRIVDNGIDPDVVRDVLALDLTLRIDDVLDLLEDYAPDVEFFQALATLGHVHRRDVERMLDAGVGPDDVRRLAEAGLTVSISDAVDLVDEGADLADLADDIERLGLQQLTRTQLERIVSEGVDLDQVAAIHDAVSDVTIDEVVDLVANGADADVITRLYRGGDGPPVSDLRRAFSVRGAPVTLGVNFHTGRTQQAWGAGRQQVAKDGRVRGVWLGSLHVLPGVRTEIDALVVGDLIVEALADVTLRGTVIGDVHNCGGRVTVTGRIRGELIDEPVVAP